MAWTRDTPWRQGNVISPADAVALGLAKNDDEKAIVVVISHDCDLAVEDQSEEPFVEVILGRRIPQGHGNYSFAKHPRRLHVDFTHEGASASIELTASARINVPKSALADYVPDSRFSVPVSGLRILQSWLSSRYRRQALPDELKVMPFGDQKGRTTHVRAFNSKLEKRPRGLRVGTALLVAALAVGNASARDDEDDDDGPGKVKRADVPDLVLFGGRISTVDAKSSTVEAIAIRDGKIIAAGRNGPVRALAKKGTQLVHLNGRRVLPGLIDGHLHGMRNAYHCFTQTVRLDLVTSRTAALSAYAAKAASLPAGRWIWTTSGGWNLNQLDTPVVFTFNELSAAAPSNPIWIQGSGVAGTRVNQAALTALGLGAGASGVLLDASGRPTGQITGAALTAANAAVIAQLDSLTLEDRAACLADFMREVNRRGMTAWKDAAGNRAPWGPAGGEIGDHFNVREPTMHLYRSGGFTARIAYHDFSNGGGPAQVLIDTRTRVGFLGDDMFRYLGPGEDTMATDAGYRDYTEYAARKRFSVETHVGDLNLILDGFEAGNAVHPIADLTWMIAHPGNGEPTDSQLARAAALKIGFSLTFSGVRNGQTGPRYRSTMQSGARMCLASDAMNVAPYAPFQNLWYVTTGKTLLPGVPGVPEGERLTREQALRHASVECAWFLGQEGRLGSLEVGRHADLIVLSDDYFSVRDDAIKDLRSVLTVVGGRVVHAEAEFARLNPPR